MRRRRFLVAALGGAAAMAGGGLLGGCGYSSTIGIGKRVTLQLNQAKSVRFAGSLVAHDQGFYPLNGLSVELRAGGPETDVESVVQSGEALVGITHPARAANAINNGAGLKIIGADYQRNPFGLVSVAERPLRTPAEMLGRRIGVQPADIPFWLAFLAANRIDPAAVQTVQIPFDPAPLVTGDVHGFMVLLPDEPTRLELAGIPVTTFQLGDFNYPLLADVYITKADSLQDQTTRSQVAGLVRAQVQGWQLAVADPERSARLAGPGLDATQQLRQAQAQNPLVVDPDTQAHGLLWMTEGKIAATTRSLSFGGVRARPDMFSVDVLQSIYQGRTSI